MAREVREFDEEKVQDCKEDMDTLLVFVSLPPFMFILAALMYLFVGWSLFSSIISVLDRCVFVAAAQLC